MTFVTTNKLFTVTCLFGTVIYSVILVQGGDQSQVESLPSARLQHLFYTSELLPRLPSFRAQFPFRLIDALPLVPVNGSER